VTTDNPEPAERAGPGSAFPAVSVSSVGRVTDWSLAPAASVPDSPCAAGGGLSRAAPFDVAQGVVPRGVLSPDAPPFADSRRGRRSTSLTAPWACRPSTLLGATLSSPKGRRAHPSRRVSVFRPCCVSTDPAASAPTLLRQHRPFIVGTDPSASVPDSSGRTW